MDEILTLPEWAKDEDEDDPDYRLKRRIEIEQEQLNDIYTTRISFSMLLERFNIDIECGEMLLHQTFIDVYDHYIQKNGEHIIFGYDEDDNTYNQLVINEKDSENFLTDRVRGSISITRIYDREGDLWFTT